MHVINCIQGDSDWLQARTGRVTASEVRRVLSELKKGGETQERATYRAALVGEMLTGVPAEHTITRAMDHGTEFEPLARSAYELHMGVMVEEVGFVIHPLIERAGASPDGLVGEDGGIEIKCPNTSTHVRWMTAGVIPEEHRAQMFWNMACTGRTWWDFVSFDPRMKDRRDRLFIRRLEAHEAIQMEMSVRVNDFLAECDEMVKEIVSKRPKESIDQADGFGITDEDIRLVDPNYNVLPINGAR